MMRGTCASMRIVAKESFSRFECLEVPSWAIISRKDVRVGRVRVKRSRSLQVLQGILDILTAVDGEEGS